MTPQETDFSGKSIETNQFPLTKVHQIIFCNLSHHFAKGRNELIHNVS